MTMMPYDLPNKEPPYFDPSKCTDDDWLGGEPTLLKDRETELEGVHSLVASLSKETNEKDNDLPWMHRVPDPGLIIRHLRAAKGNLPKTLQAIKAALTFRQDFQVDRLRFAMNGKDEEFAGIVRGENVMGKTYVRGWNQDGRALLYLLPHFNTNFDRMEDDMHHLVWNLEKAIAVTRAKSLAIQKEKAKDDPAAPSSPPQPLEQYIILMDLSQYSMRIAPKLSTARFTVDVLQTHYPERCHRTYLLNPGTAFRVLWKVMRPFMDAETLKKTVVIHGDCPALSELHEDVGPEMMPYLEDCVNGSNVDNLKPFDSEEYLALPMHVPYDDHEHEK